VVRTDFEIGAGPLGVVRTDFEIGRDRSEWSGRILKSGGTARSEAGALEAVMKAEIIEAVRKAMAKKSLTHAAVARTSGLPRSAVTGILSGSLQRVTLDRLLKLVEAVGLTMELRVRNAA
jgi:predicted XRE-type DNA-binding protein